MNFQNVYFHCLTHSAMKRSPVSIAVKQLPKIVESHLIKKILLEYAFSMCMKGSFANSPKKYMF